MAFALYFDHDSSTRWLIGALRARGVDCLTAHEDGRREATDTEILDRSKELDRVLVTSDLDHALEHARRAQAGHDAGRIVIYKQGTLTPGELLDDLDLIAKSGSPEDFQAGPLRLPI